MTYQQISFTKGFIKQFKKLPDQKKQKFYERLKLFKEDPYSKLLNNHALKGTYLGYRSINIEADPRTIYRVDNTNVILTFLGSHSELYG